MRGSNSNARSARGWQRSLTTPGSQCSPLGCHDPRKRKPTVKDTGAVPWSCGRPVGRGERGICPSAGEQCASPGTDSRLLAPPHRAPYVRLLGWTRSSPPTGPLERVDPDPCPLCLLRRGRLAVRAPRSPAAAGRRGRRRRRQGPAPPAVPLRAGHASLGQARGQGRPGSRSRSGPLSRPAPGRRDRSRRPLRRLRRGGAPGQPGGRLRRCSPPSVLSWLPDRSPLGRGGRPLLFARFFYIAEAHPFAWAFDDEDTATEPPRYHRRPRSRWWFPDTESYADPEVPVRRRSSTPGSTAWARSSRPWVGRPAHRVPPRASLGPVEDVPFMVEAEPGIWRLLEPDDSRLPAVLAQGDKGLAW